MSGLCSMPYLDNGGDGEAVECWSEERVRARKVHRCTECGGTIQPGDSYGRAQGVEHNFGWITWRRCPACMALAEWVAAVLNGCPVWGALNEAIDEANDGKSDADSIPYPREYRERWDADGKEGS